MADLTNQRIIAERDGDWVQLPTDATGKRVKHVQVDEVQSDGTVTTVYYPAFVVVDDKGNIVGIRDRALKIDNRELLASIENLSQGIAHLILTLNKVGRPRSSTPAADTWVAETLGHVGGGQ